MNMIEKVTEKIVEELVKQAGSWDYANFQRDRGLMRYDGEFNVASVARAAIEAMREPTGRMIDAVAGEEQKRGYFASESLDCCDAWPIMIDAALSEDVTSPTSSGVSA